VLSRVAGVGWSVVLFLAGGVFDLLALVNVPGSTNARASLTGFGAVLFLATSLAWLLVFVRKHHPLLPLIAGGVLLLTGVSYFLVLVGAFHAALRWRGRARVIGAGVVLGVAGFVIREVLTPWGGALPFVFAGNDRNPANPAGWNVASAVIAVVALAAAFGWYAYARTSGEVDSHRQRAEQEQQRADLLGEQLARQTERERLARDIHDALAHRLSVISLHAGAFEAQAATDPVLLRRARTLREQAHAGLEDLRGLLGDLRSPRAAAPSGGPTSMKSIGHLLREVREGGVRVDAYVLIDDADRATALLDSAVYRIVQESLTNAIKHAPGAPVSAYVEASAATGVRVRVSNPLAAPALRLPGSGQGTTSIRERAAAVGGQVWIGESEGAFVVDASLPWSERA